MTASMIKSSQKCPISEDCDLLAVLTKWLRLWSQSSQNDRSSISEDCDHYTVLIKCTSYEDCDYNRSPHKMSCF